MRRSTRVVLALLAALALVAGACAQDTDDVALGEFTGVSITFSTSLAEEERDAVNELVGRFETQTGAAVNIAAVTSADLPEKLKVEVAAGEATIHLFAQDNLALRVLVDEQLVQEVDDVEIPDAVIDAMIPDTFDGKSFFLPYRPNVRVAYVNTERFNAADVAPPQTHTEFRAVAEQLKAEAGTPKVTLSLAEGDPAAVTISEWIVSFGGDPLILNDEGSVEAFEFLQALWQDELLAKETLQAKFDTEVDNLRGEVAWLAQNWPFTSGVFADEGLIDRFNVYAGWSGPERAAHVIGGEVLGIPTGVSDEQREAAVALATFLMSREAQEVLAEQNAWPSIRDDAYATVPEDQQGTFEAITAAFTDGWFRPNVPYWSDVSDAMNEGVRRIMVGGEDTQTVLDALHDDIAEAAEQKDADYPPA